MLASETWDASSIFWTCFKNINNLLHFHWGTLRSCQCYLCQREVCCSLSFSSIITRQYRHGCRHMTSMSEIEENPLLVVWTKTETFCPLVFTARSLWEHCCTCLCCCPSCTSTRTWYHLFLRLWDSVNHHSNFQVFGQLHQFTKWRHCVLPTRATSHSCVLKPKNKDSSRMPWRRM